MQYSISKQILRILVILGIALISLLILLYIFVQTSPGRNFLKNFLEDKFSQTLNMEVTIDNFQTNLVSHLKITDVDIIDRSQVMSYLEMDELEVHYNIFSLLSNKIAISDILMEGLHVHIYRDKEGNLLLPEIAKDEKSSTKPIEISIKKVNFENSSINYSDLALRLSSCLKISSVFVKHNAVIDKYDFTGKFSFLHNVYNNNVIGFNDLCVDGTLTQTELQIKNISFLFKGLHAKGTLSADLTQSNSFYNGVLTIDGDPNTLIEYYGRKLPVRYRPQMSDIQTKISFTGSPDDPNITANLKIPKIVAEEIDMTNTTLKVCFFNDTLRIDTLSTEIFAGNFSTKGFVTVDTLQNFSIESSFSGINIIPLWAYVYPTQSLYSGSFYGSLAADGSLKNILTSSISGSIESNDFAFKNKSIPDLNTSFSYRNKKGEFDLTQGTSKISAHVSLEDSILSGNAVVDVKEIEYIAGLFNLLDARGKLYADAEFSGDITNPKINAQMRGSGLSYSQFPVDSLCAEIQYADSSIFVKSSSFSGKMDSIPPFVATLMNEEVLGRVQYKGSISGTLEDFSGNFSLHADSVKYQEFSVPSLVLECSAKNSDISVNKLHIDTEKVRCEAKGDFSLSERSGNVFVDFINREKKLKNHFGSVEGSFSLSDNISLNANMKELSLEMLGAFSDSLAGIQGNISGDISFKGTVDKPAGTLSLTIDKPAYNDFIVDKIALQGNLTPSEIILSNGAIQLFKNEIRIRGKIGLDEGKGSFAVSPKSTLQGEISLSEVKLADFTQEFLDAIQVQGTLTSTVQIGGSVAAPLINGSLRIKDGFIQLDKHKSPIENLDAMLVFSDSTLNINKCTGLYEGKTFSLTGSISESGWSSFSPNIALSINGMQAVCLKGTFQQDDIDLHMSLDEFDIAFIKTLSPAIMNAQGSVNASVDIRGTMQTPLFRGYVKADNIDVHPTDIPVALSECTLDISATDERLTLQEFQCMFDKGSIKSSGYVDYGNGSIKDIALNLEAENIALKQPKMYQFTLKSCSLNYKQQKTGYLIEGSVVLGKTKYLQDIHLSKVLDSLKKPKIFQKPSQLMMQTKLNVRITESKDIWIDNNLARICLKADVGVIGTLAQPNLTGRIETTEGYIVYLDRKFEITRGVMDFTDPNVINPILDIQAETDIKNYEQPDAAPYHIIFAVTGPADKATITLQSIPSLDEANILSLITIGTTREQIFSQSPDKYDTSLKDILLERAEQYSSQKISGYIAGKMANIFALDDVTIEGNFFNFGDSWGPQLVASKQLSKRMKVTYSTRIGYLNEQSIELDYKLGSHFYLQGQADQEGNAGVDLIYRVNFK